MKIISRGAEGILYVENGRLVKERIKKGYRVKELDEKIRKIRTKSEARLLERANNANVPSVYDYSDKSMKIVMEYLDGKLVKDFIDGLDAGKLKNLCFEIGRQIARLHNNDVIHGDLTTSNMIARQDKLYIIDFGLGFVSKRTEDKAVDLRLLRQALESKHYRIAEKAFSYVLEGYEKEARDADDVVKRLREKVEKRGRYKRKAKAFKNS